MKRAAIQTVVALVMAGMSLAAHGTGAWAQPTATLTQPAPGATRQLYVGCNNVALTFPNGTTSATVEQAVTPAGALHAMWRHDASLNKFEGFSPAAPQASDLQTVNFLDAAWLCIDVIELTTSMPPTPATPTPATGTPHLPLPGGSTSPPSTAAVPTPGLSPAPTTTPMAVIAPTEALDSFAYVYDSSVTAGESTISFRVTGQFKAPDSVSCSVSGQMDGVDIGVGQLVVTDEGAWIDDGNGFVPVSKDDPELADHLMACPGSQAFWEGFYLPSDLPPGVPEEINGVPAQRYSLAQMLLEEPASFGAEASELEGVTINAFDVWVAEDGGWLARLVADMSVDAEALGEDSGLQPGQQIRTVMQLDITDANRPDIHIEPPAP